MDNKHDHKHDHGDMTHDHDHHHHGHDHDHDHDHHHEEEPITLNLVLDNGEELQSEVIGIFEVEGKEYIALLPENDDKIILYLYEEVGDEVNLENIEDEEEFKKVSDTFWEIFGEEGAEGEETKE